MAMGISDCTQTAESHSHDDLKAETLRKKKLKNPICPKTCSNI